MLNYADEVSRAKREHPGDDIASVLVQAEVDGDRLTDAELNWFFLLLVNAGGDTTRNLVAAGVQLLFENPDERARLQADLDGLLPTAVDEMLRCTSPVAHFRRTAMEDTVIRDQPIAAGDKVMVFYGSGNRDERCVRRIPTGSTSAATRTRTWRSAEEGHTCALACTSRGSRSQRCSTSCFRGALTSLPQVTPSAWRRASSPGSVTCR